MTIRHIFLFIIFIASFQHFLSAQTGTIKGRVFNHKNNEPIPFANVIIDGKPTQGAASDIDGNFIIRQVEPGFTRLVATSVGYNKYVSEDFLVTNNKTMFIEIPMDELLVTLEEVVVRPGAFIRKEESPVSVQALTLQEIERSPGSNRDISRVIQSLPGVASGPAFRNDLIVRGGGPGENRFYLDDVEIPNLNHFATQGASGGPNGIINTDLIREVELYSGAFPAKRGNALSSVLEMKQIDGNKERFGGRLTIGTSDLGLRIDGPISKNSNLVFSYRRSYLELLFGVLGLPFLPTYNDYQLKYKIQIDQKNQISLISIGSLDNLTLNTGIKDPDAFQKYVLNALPVQNQWTYAVGLTYRHFRKNGNDLLVFSRNMLNNERFKYKDNDKSPPNLLLDYVSQEIENKFRYEGITDLNEWKFGYGLGGEYARYNNDTYQKLFLGNELKTLEYKSNLDLFKWHIQGQASRSLFDDRLELSLGIRMDANNYSKEMQNMLEQFSPRFSASYRIVNGLFLNFNTGRYYQLPAYTTLGYRDQRGKLVNDSLGVRYIAVNHYVAGLEFLPADDVKLSVEGFFKAYSRYPISLNDSVSLASKGNEYTVVGDEPVKPDSKGRAYGFEVLFRDVNLFGFNVILTYTFVRSEFTNIFGAYIPSSWDNRHLINVTIGKKFKRNWEIGAKWRFAGGAPYTPYNEEVSSLVTAWDAQGRGYFDFDRFNSLRLRSFNQLDLRVDKSFFFKKWSLMIYLDVQNVLNFKSEQPDILVNTQEDGSVQKYIDPQGNERYDLRYINGSSGTIVPSIGIMIQI